MKRSHNFTSPLTLPGKGQMCTSRLTFASSLAWGLVHPFRFHMTGRPGTEDFSVTSNGLPSGWMMPLSNGNIAALIFHILQRHWNTTKPQEPFFGRVGEVKVKELVW